MGYDLGPSVRDCLFESFGIKNDVWCILGERFETSHFHRLGIAHQSVHFRHFPTESSEIFHGDLGFRSRPGKFGEQALIELDRVFLAVLLAADFGEAEKRGGSESTLLGVAGENLLVTFRGSFDIASDFLGVEAVAQEIARRWFFGAGGGSGEDQAGDGETVGVEVHG